MTEHVDASIPEVPGSPGAPSSPGKVGQQLRAAREARQLTIEEAASQLRLAVRHLDALEHEDLSRLPDPSYVCGYLRAYAKFLNLPSNEIVENFPGVREHVRSVKSTVMPTKLLTPHEEKAEVERQPWLRAGALLVAVVVVVGVLTQVGSWFGKEENSADSTKPTASSVQDAPETLAVTPDEPVVQPTPAASRAEAPLAVPASVPATVVSVITTPVVNAMNSGAADIPPVQPAKANLSMEFSGDSWVEIYDAGEQRLMFELVRKGETRTLSGRAPFRILLGVTPNVHIRVNGAVFDKTPYPQPEVAILHVGKDQDNRVKGSGE